MKKFILLGFVNLLFSFTYLQAQDIINPVSATTTLTAEFGTNLINTINGSGLDAFPSLTADHGMSVFGNSFVAINETGSIDFDLGGSYLVDGLAFWNQNFFGPVPGENGIQEVLISSSNDGVTYTPITGAPNIFAQTTCMSCPSEQFSFTEVMTSFIRFDVINNWGEPTYVGFSEVAFSGIEATVPVENVINPVSATTTLSAEFGSSLVNTINGSGLDAFPSLSASHGGANPGTAFYATNGTGTIDFDLGGSYLVDGLSFWNANATGPGQTGIQDVLIYSSEDGVTYSPISGATSVFTEAVSTSSMAQQFAFTEVTASFIRLEVISNYGSPDFVGFSEIAFSGVSTLGVTDYTLSDVISLYPNPAINIITINNKSKIELEGITIYDMNGRMVKHLDVKNNNLEQTIDLSDLVSGIYMVKIFNNQTYTVKRVIKN
ncbi:T9SS type A sorting domain-containing protein [Psychroflexus sp. MES1-P1E]|uniref:T9SS type A sorting domain-containing protein n=1 Tax=Psychroflexus sp. MES1-P1E TaxID=2058320 RepID=UPI000C7D7582|nr:T9SS type A sorting domain-containing protein [Psychroflexus sp. MES1-P1E]PKG44114.1 hypothetical protein CXF67_01260 [Psychroflexus sp. MES1-P1E]